MLAGGTFPNKANLVTQQNIFHAIRITNGSCVALQVIETPGWIGKMGAIRCQTPEKMDQGSKLFLPPKTYQSYLGRFQVPGATWLGSGHLPTPDWTMGCAKFPLGPSLGVRID